MTTENNETEQQKTLSIFSPHNDATRVYANRYWHAPVKLDTVFAGVLAASVASIVGAGSTGKGFFALGICLDLYTGKDHLGLGIGASEDSPRLTPDQKIAFITLEDQADVVGNRLHYLQRNQGMTSQESIRMDEQVHFVSIQGHVFDGLVDNQGIVNYRLANEIISVYKGYRLIFLDTLARTHQATENDNGDMSKLISVFEYIAKCTGAALVFIHHTNKNANMNGLGGEQGASRGAAAITDNIRCQINLSKMTEAEAEKHEIREDQRDQYVMMKNSKINYAESGGVKILKRTEGGVLKKYEKSHQQGGTKCLFNME